MCHNRDSNGLTELCLTGKKTNKKAKTLCSTWNKQSGSTVTGTFSVAGGDLEFQLLIKT